MDKLGDIILGVDPGASGSLAVIDVNCKLIDIIDFNEDEVINHLHMYHKRVVKAGIEQVHSMPGQGVVSVFAFGQNFGWWKGVLDVFDIEYTEIRPQEWKKKLGLTMPKDLTKTKEQRKKEGKAMACKMASDLWGSEWFYGKRGGLKDGRAEAALIAKYVLTRVAK